MVVGISLTAEADPHNANWSCEAFLGTSDRTCRGFYWEGTDMKPLETLGGYNGFATMANNLGQIVGWAETASPDPTCKAPQVLGFPAVVWEPRANRKQALPPLPGDPASAATAINDRGQVVGISGKCYVAVGDSSARASVLWEDAVPTEIPNLGGATWNTPMDINNAGDVVGFSNLGDINGAPRLRAFLWTGGTTAQQLDSLPGDNGVTQAYGINSRRQVVGRSCGPSGCRAVLWENGVVYDLNQLAGAGADVLALARHINDAGVITGNLTEAGTGKTLMYVAIPRGRPNN
jgi:probable HAF family extracellular repeat protein